MSIPSLALLCFSTLHIGSAVDSSCGGDAGGCSAALPSDQVSFFQSYALERRISDAQETTVEAGTLQSDQEMLLVLFNEMEQPTNSDAIRAAMSQVADERTPLQRIGEKHSNEIVEKMAAMANLPVRIMLENDVQTRENVSRHMNIREAAKALESVQGQLKKPELQSTMMQILALGEQVVGDFPVKAALSNMADAAIALKDKPSVGTARHESATLNHEISKVAKIIFPELERVIQNSPVSLLQPTSGNTTPPSLTVRDFISEVYPPTLAGASMRLRVFDNFYVRIGFQHARPGVNPSNETYGSAYNMLTMDLGLAWPDAEFDFSVRLGYSTWKTSWMERKALLEFSADFNSKAGNDLVGYDMFITLGVGAHWTEGGRSDLMMVLNLHGEPWMFDSGIMVKVGAHVRDDNHLLYVLLKPFQYDLFSFKLRFISAFKVAWLHDLKSGEGLRDLMTDIVDHAKLAVN